MTDETEGKPLKVPPQKSFVARGLAQMSSGQRYLFTAQLTSSLGTKVTAVAIPSLAVLDLGATAFQASLIVAAEYTPAVLVGPISGVLADRMGLLKRGMALADAVRALALISVPLVYALGTVRLPQLYLVAAVVGLCSPLHNASSQTLIPRIIDGESDLTQANSLQAVSGYAGDVTGPALGGLLVAVFGSALALVADSVSYAVSALLLSRIREPRRIAQTGGSVRSELAEGFREVVGEKLLGRLIVGAAVLNLLGSGIGGLYVVFAYRTLGLNPQELAATFAVGALSGIAGGAAASPLLSRIGMRAGVTWGAALAGASLLIIPLAALGHGFVVLCAYQAVFTPAATVWGVALVTLRQSVAAPETLARVTAFAQTALLVTVPCGAALAGAVATRFGVTATVTVFAAIATVSFTFYLGGDLWSEIPGSLTGTRNRTAAQKASVARD